MMDAENTKMDEERVTALENVQSNRKTGMRKKTRQSRLTWQK